METFNIILLATSSGFWPEICIHTCYTSCLLHSSRPNRS